MNWTDWFPNIPECKNNRHKSKEDLRIVIGSWSSEANSKVRTSMMSHPVVVNCKWIGQVCDPSEFGVSVRIRREDGIQRIYHHLSILFGWRAHAHGRIALTQFSTAPERARRAVISPGRNSGTSLCLPTKFYGLRVHVSHLTTSRLHFHSTKTCSY